jgi:hypothetical protein
MTEEYEYLENGLIKQVNYKKIEYNYDYNEKYNNYKEKGAQLSYLRLGILLGNLGFTPEKILDVGYGNGDFLRASKTADIKECCGYDLSTYPVPEDCTKVDSMYTEKYDVVTFFDSLEHFDDIYIIKNITTDYVFISVPHCHNYSKEWFMNWYHRRPNEHLWHFNEKSIVLFFKEIGYELIYMSNFEDTIRKNKIVYPDKNILSCIFKKI